MKRFRAALAAICFVTAFCTSGCSDASDEEVSSARLPAATSSVTAQETTASYSSADTYYETYGTSESLSAYETDTSAAEDGTADETISSSAEISSADVTGITGNSSDTEMTPAGSAVSETSAETSLTPGSSEAPVTPLTEAETAAPVQTSAPVTASEDIMQSFETISTLPENEEDLFPQASESVQTETLALDETSPAETEASETETTGGKKKKIVYMTYQEFFEKSLFVGDSICSGLKVYGGLLPTENVAARINVSTWGIEKYTFQYKTNSSAELGAYDIAKLYQPEDIYIWMGMNDLYVVSEDKFCENLDAIADKFLEVSPESKIHVLSISPMTAGHKWNVELDGNNRVNTYNAAAEKYCAESDKLDWINIHDVLIDANGYLASENNGGDGLHLSASAYQKVLNKVVDHKLGRD